MDAVLTDEQGKELLRTARQTIAAKLGSEEEATPSADPGLAVSCGTFVTLKINGTLRGCIGNLQAAGSVLDGVKRNAENAAFHDPRFRPLGAEELEQVQIDVSVLSPPQILQYRDADDLIKKLKPGTDGVILKLGSAGATFLPQVWEQLPKPELFLDHLCQKAGLNAAAWRSEHPRIEIYQVQAFEEEVR
jgi:AmmeMemoRadiSam system protein A